MKLFITGGAGFIGSNFINQFFKKHKDSDLIFSLINFDALYYSGDIENVAQNIRELQRFAEVLGERLRQLGRNAEDSAR